VAVDYQNSPPLPTEFPNGERNRLLALGMPSGDIGIENREVPTFSEKKAFVKFENYCPGQFRAF
jgi:hypothetical protein